MPRGRPRKNAEEKTEAASPPPAKRGRRKKMVDIFPVIKYYKYSPSTMNYKETSYERYIKNFSSAEQSEVSDKLRVLKTLCREIDFNERFIEIATDKVSVILDEKNFEFEAMPYMLKVKSPASDINVGIADIRCIRSALKSNSPNIFKPIHGGYDRK